MENTDTMEPTFSSSPKAKMPVVVKAMIALVIIALVSAGYFYNQTRILSQDPNKINQEKITALVAKVSMLIDLPTGETPVLATVTDLAPLAGNPFFAKAKVGDEVLLYPVAQQVFLYDPTQNIIVEVASLNIGNK